MFPFSNEDLKPVIENVLNKIRPSLALDGGSVKFIDVNGATVYVQLQGACVGCIGSSNTLKYGIERQLKIDIHPDIVVVNVPIGMEDRLNEIK